MFSGFPIINEWTKKNKLGNTGRNPLNRHFVSLILILALLFSLISCSGEDSPSLHGEITAEIDGEEKSIPVTLYAGENYSIYIPDEGWDMRQQSDERDCWVSTENEQVFLNIAMRPGQTLEDTREDILFFCEGFTFGEIDEENHFFGEDSFTEQTADVWLLETPGGTLIVWAEYTFSTAKDFGPYLAAIADTIQITD